MPFVPPACADEATDWKDLNALRKQISEEPLKSHPDQAREQLQTFCKSRVLDPVVEAEAEIQMADITRTQLNRPDEAMRLLQAGWQTSQQKIDLAKPAGVMYLDTIAAALMDDKKVAEVKSLLEDNQAAIFAGGTSGNGNIEIYTSRAVQRLADAQDLLRDADGLPDDTVKLLKTPIVQMPTFLDPERQRAVDWHKGWMYERLMTSMVKASQGEEALKWGKLYFAESAYKQDSLERATAALNGVWIALGVPAKVRAFAQAQAVAKGDSPLAAVSFPTLAGPQLKVGLDRLQKWQKQWNSRDRMVQIISLEMARGNWKGAMEAAQGMLQSDANAPDGPQQIARVFKGKDGSMARANQFLSYLDGKAENPLPAFLAETEMQGTPTP